MASLQSLINSRSWDNVYIPGRTLSLSKVSINLYIQQWDSGAGHLLSIELLIVSLCELLNDPNLEQL